VPYKLRDKTWLNLVKLTFVDVARVGQYRSVYVDVAVVAVQGVT